MKKIIRDRSIFVVLASIIMAGVMLFCSTHTVASVRLPAEVRSVLGKQADVSFSAFFDEVQAWYDSCEIVDNTVTLTKDSDYDATMKVFDTITGYLTACGNITDEAEMELVGTFSQPLVYFLTEYTMILTYLDMFSAFSLPAEDWATFGESIDALTALYQDYQVNFPG